MFKRLTQLSIVAVLLSSFTFAQIKAIANLSTSSDSITSDANGIYVTYNVVVTDTSQPGQPVAAWASTVYLPDTNTASQNASACASKIRSDAVGYGVTIPNNQLYIVLPSRQ